jgi:hypothetical protein
MQKTMRNCGPLPYKQKQIGATLKTLPASERICISYLFSLHDPSPSDHHDRSHGHSRPLRHGRRCKCPQPERTPRSLRPLPCAAHIFVPSANDVISEQATSAVQCTRGPTGVLRRKGVGRMGAMLAGEEHAAQLWSRPSDSDFSADLAWACCAARHDLPLRRSPPPERR